MAVIPMEKIRLLLHRSKAEAALGALQKIGAIHFNEIPATKIKGLKKETKEKFEIDYASGRLDMAVAFLQKYEKPSFLRRAFEGDKHVTSDQEILELTQTFNYQSITDQITTIESKINYAKNQLETLKEEETLLKEWEELDIPISLLKETRSCKVLLLRGKSEDFAILQKLSSEKIPLSKFIKVKDQSAVLIFAKKEEGTIKTILNGLKLAEITLPRREKTPREELQKIASEKNSANAQIIKAEKEAALLAKHLTELKILSDYTRWQKDKYDLLTNTCGSKEILVFEGWSPCQKLPDIKNQLSKITNLFEIEVIARDPGENPPVEITNQKIVSPFEAVTRLYGLPHHKDLDPTPFLAGFFFLFFGFSLSDFGYGFFITAVTLAIMLSYRLGKESKLFLSLIMFGGISSMLFGLLFGGYLGISVHHLPPIFQHIQLFDPIAAPLNVLYLALALGVVQVVFGVVLRLIKDGKNISWKTSILDHAPWLFLFLALGIFGASSIYQPINNFLPLEPQYLLYSAFAIIIITQGRKEASLLKKFFTGVLSLYNSISYLSDILSYSRLLALALATSALAFSINLIANMANEMIPYIGGLIAILIAFIGHTFNLAVNVLGAFIHSARLQFVEFFGKFVSGGGKSFKPFREEAKYAIIKINSK